MELPVRPPLAPMLAKLARELPMHDHIYEPKWDGFRCIAFRDRGEVELYSRRQRPLGRYFPEIAEALCALGPEKLVLDGEIIVMTEHGFDFGALLARLHPAASRVRQLRQKTPAHFIAFDVIASGEDDLMTRPFAQRRELLIEAARTARPPVLATLATEDHTIAEGWLHAFTGGGVDGVVAKHRSLRYEPNRRAMVKVKHEQTADCVVAGFRVFFDEPMVASLLLGLYDDATLRHVGVASSFTDRDRMDLFAQLQSLVTSLEDHPWAKGFGLGRSPIGRLAGAAGRWTPELEQDWIPVRPKLVCEVAHDQWDGDRFRHPVRFRRWRPDRDPRSCTLDQLTVATPSEIEAFLAQG